MTTEIETKKTIVEPVANHILVRPDDAADTTKGGIILPDMAKEKPAQGEILACGPGKRNDAGEVVPLDLAVGDKVIFSKYAGTDLKVDGEACVLLKDTDCLCKIRYE